MKLKTPDLPERIGAVLGAMAVLRTMYRAMLDTLDSCKPSLLE